MVKKNISFYERKKETITKNFARKEMFILRIFDEENLDVMDFRE